jgi:hypothetical protein
MLWAMDLLLAFGRDDLRVVRYRYGIAVDAEVDPPKLNRRYIRLRSIFAWAWESSGWKPLLLPMSLLAQKSPPFRAGF